MNMAELYRLKRFDIFVAYMLYVALNIVVFPLENKVCLSITFYNICLTHFCLILFLYSQNVFISEYE